MNPVRLEDENGNLLSSTTVVTGKRKLPDLSTVMRLAREAEDSRGPYGQALPGMTVTPDTEVRKQITLNDIKNAVVDNPAKTALAVGGTGAAILGAPLTIPAAAVLGMAAEGADKFRPFSDRESDYKTMTPAENMVDIGSAGVFSVLGDATLHGIGSGARQFNRMADDALARVARVGSVGKTWTGIPEDIPRYIPAPKHFGHPEGNDILNYDYFPQWSVDYANELERLGHPRFIKGAVGTDYEGKIVGNPIYRNDPNTPEGIELVDAGGTPGSPVLLSGGRPNRDIYSMGKLTKLDPNNPPGVFDFPVKDQPGMMYKPQWATDHNILGPGYVRPSGEIPYGDNMMDQLTLFREVGDAIRTGKINEHNLPIGYKSVKEVEDVLYGLNPDKGFSPELGRRFLHETGDPRLGSVQEFQYIGSNPYNVDMHRQWWNSYAKMQDIDPHLWQRGAILQAIQNNSDALVFKSMRDPPAFEYGIPEEVIKSKGHYEPIDVHVMLDPREYISNYNLGPIKKQGNPMNALPFAALGALGATAAKDRQ